MNVFMLVDMEPGLTPMRRGESVEVSTEWWKGADLPDDLITRDLPVTIVHSDGETPGYTYSIAIADECSIEALLTGSIEQPLPAGPATLSGCLVWDPHMEVVHPGVVPTTRGKVRAFGLLVESRSDGSVRYVPWPDAETSHERRSAPHDARVLFRCVELDVSRPH